MGVKRIQKTSSSASMQKKAKQEEDGNQTKSFKGGRARAPTKSYYESDNSCMEDSDEDPDFEKAAPQKKQPKRKMVSESDGGSSSEEEIKPKAKTRKPRSVSTKKKGVPAKKRKPKKKCSDSGNSSDDRTKDPFSRNVLPLLSSEGSDSDVPIAESRAKKVKNALESKPTSHKVDETKEPGKSLKLINKNMDADQNTLENKDVDSDRKSKDLLNWMMDLGDSDEEEEDGKGIKAEIKTEIKTEPPEPIAVKGRKDSKKKSVAATRKGKVRSKAVKCEVKEEEESGADLKERSKPKVTKRNSKSKSSKTPVAKKERKSSKLKNLDDVSAVLMQIEGKMGGNKLLSSDSEDGEAATGRDSSESDDWEEVEDDPSVPSTSSGKKPQQTIEITLENKQFVKRKKKKGNFDMAAHFRKLMNVFRRDLQIVKHKVHLLCLIGHGMVLNRLCCDPVLKALSFSLIPATTGKTDFTEGKIKDLLKSFSTNVQLTPLENDAQAPTYFSIVNAFSNREAKGTKEYTMMVLMVLRSLGLKVRFVMSFHPIPMKEPKDEKKSTKNAKSKKSQKVKTPVVKKGNDAVKKRVPKKGPKKEPKEKKNSKTVKKTQNKMAAPEESDEIDDDDDDDDDSTKKKRPSRRKSQNISYIEPVGSDLEEEDEEVPEKKSKSGKKTLASKVAEKMSSSSNSVSSDDFEEVSVKFASPRRTQPKPGHRIISSSSSNSSFQNNPDNGTETWIEVYLVKEKTWLSVDCVNMVFADLSHFENLDSRPLTYIVTFDNDCYLKDVTPRYASQWMLKTKKLRVEEEWWEKTLKPYLKEDEESKREDDQIQDVLLKQPLPKSISEYKSHPLYALTRHLLKFEAIYPNSAVPLGYLRKEPVYARECVRQLHSRETWLKDGRSVKLGEEPYKMVKSRPKWNKPKENPDVPDLPVFGFWQTEIYVPPPAVDGKIPRNEYGNVELYKASMLPAGTVHIRESGLNKVCRKLGFDCAAAMIGWDFHGGSSHPVFDGWVVCVENKEAILEEWEIEQERALIREIEKREKRVYGNWKKLIRGLLIRERIKKKYNLEEPQFLDEQQEEAAEAKPSLPQNEKTKNEKITKSKQGKKKM